MQQLSIFLKLVPSYHWDLGIELKLSRFYPLSLLTALKELVFLKCTLFRILVVNVICDIWETKEKLFMAVLLGAVPRADRKWL